MTSTDGATWRPLQPLFSGALPKGAGAGYTRNPDGSVEIETMAGGFFALLPETAPPPAPAGLTGQLLTRRPRPLVAGRERCERARDLLPGDARPTIHCSRSLARRRRRWRPSTRTRRASSG